MKGNRNDRVDLFEKIPTGMDHEMHEGAGDISSIRMFEPKDHAARSIVITKHCTRPSIKRRRDGTAPAKGFVGNHLGQWVTATTAKGWADQGQLLPALGAKAGLTIDHRPTTKATMGQNHIQKVTERLLHRLSDRHFLEPNNKIQPIEYYLCQHSARIIWE